MEKETKTRLISLVILSACSVVLAISTSPIGLPLMSALISKTKLNFESSTSILTSKNPIDSWLTFMESAHTQDGFIFHMLAWIAICGTLVALLVAYAKLQSPNRRVSNGILGDARMIDSAAERRQRNVCWDGQGQAPGPSLVFGYEQGKMMGDPNFAHGWVDAKSGAGKSRSIGYASLYWNIKAGASVIYTARKLTEYKLCAEPLETRGIRTFLLDLERPKRGSRFNLMDAVNACVDAHDIAGAQRASRQLAADFVKHDEKNPYFSNAAKALLAAAILIVSMSEDVKQTERNLVSVADVIRRGMTGSGKDPSSPLKDYIRSLGVEHPAYKAAAEFLQDNGTTAGRNVASTLMTGITILGDEGIEYMLSGSDFTLRQLAEDQCVLMPHCLGEDDPYNVVIAAMYNQLWTMLQEIAAEHGDKLPRPFVILGDEWGNLPRVQCLGEMVSLGRSMDLHIFVFVQNMLQLGKYNDSGDNGAGMDKLLGSMNLQIAMSVMKARPDGEYFSELCGKQTVRAQTQGTTKQPGTFYSHASSSDSLAEQAIDLLPPSSFKDRVPLRDGIIVIKGGENSAPDHEGVFTMPIVDATKIPPVRDFFLLGTKEQDRKRSEEMERLLDWRSMHAPQDIPRWHPNFEATIRSETIAEDIEEDEFMQWDADLA